MSDPRPAETAGAPEKTQIRRPSRLCALLLYLTTAAGLILCSLLLPANTNSNLVNVTYYALFFAVPVALTIRKTGLEAFRPNPISLRCMIAVILLALNGVLLADNLTVLWAIPFQKLGLDVNATAVSIPSDTRGLVVSIFVVAVIPGICEEFLFRGAILSGLEESGTKRAIFATSALFALLHGSVIGLPAQFLIGLVITCVVVCSDSVYAGVIYHTVHNAASILLQFIQQRSAAPEELESALDYYEAIGGAAGVMTLIVEIVMSLAILLMLLRMFRMRALLHKVQSLPDRKSPLCKSEWAVLIGALICVFGLYFADVVLMRGGVK